MSRSGTCARAGRSITKRTARAMSSGWSALLTGRGVGRHWPVLEEGGVGGPGVHNRSADAVFTCLLHRGVGQRGQAGFARPGRRRPSGLAAWPPMS